MKIKVLIAIRLVLITIAMIGGPFMLGIEKVPSYTIFAVFYLLTLIYVILLKTKLPLVFQAYLQIILDMVLETVIIHYTGGVDSVYAFLYAPSIVSAGVIISSKAAKIFAGLSSIFYVTITGLEYFGVIKPFLGAEALYSKGLFIVMLIVSFRVIIFCLVGYLSSYLAYNLAKERIELFKLKNLSDIILRNISSGVLTLDRNLYVIYANPMAMKIFGRDGNDLIGVPFSRLIWGEEGRDPVERFLRQAKSPNGIEIDIIRMDGRRKNLCFSFADLVDDKGRIIGGVLTFIDLTPLKELEMEIRQREKLGAMGEMAVAIAHQIRNPMASIRGAVEVMKERGFFQRGGEELAGIVLKETDRLNCIIEDFLRYAKERSVNIESWDIGELIDEVWLLVKQSDKWQKDIMLEKNIHPPHIVIQIDRDRIKQVLYNIFMNAIEACYAKTVAMGGVPITPVGKINADVTEEATGIRIVIKDNGIGMSKEQLDRISQGFYSTKSYGFGMGLMISRRIVESHGGTIKLDSEEGKGTTVLITLPKIRG